MSTPEVWRFGQFELNPAQHKLTSSGTVIHIQPKTYEVLLTLLKHAGQLVSREQLLTSVWAETHVSDANLTNSIAALRKYLGADAIETVSKFGYRFRLEIAAKPGITQAAFNLLSEGKANMLRRTTEGVAAAQRLFWLTIAEEPAYAEAWAWLARSSRYLEKFRAAPEQNRRLAEGAFRRAFALDPDLPCAHQFYTTFQADCGNAVLAMKRLLERVAKYPQDAHSYAGLVQVCRFSGLLDASLAAHNRAVQLDPDLSTSVPHTHFARCDYKAVVESYVISGRQARGYLDAAAWASLGAKEIPDEISERLTRCAWPPLFQALLRSLSCALAGNAAEVKTISFEQDVSDDPESALYFSRHLARCGCSTEAVALLQQSANSGMSIPALLEHDPWLRPLHPDAAFQKVKREVIQRHQYAKEVFETAGGAELLSVSRSVSG